MRIAKIEWRRFLPIENPRSGMSFSRVIDISQKIKKLIRKENLDYVSLIQHGESFIVWDGHGRTSAYILQGRLLVPSAILETDEDLRRTLDDKSDNQTGIKGFLEEYLTVIAPELEQYGIKSFADYPVVQELARRQNREIMRGR